MSTVVAAWLMGQSLLINETETTELIKQSSPAQALPLTYGNGVYVRHGNLSRWAYRVVALMRNESTSVKMMQPK